jgi:NADH dehydrogenase
MKGRIVVLGGSGFIGRHIVARLVETGYAVVVPTRRRESAKELWPLPTVDVRDANVHDRAVLARLLDGADAVVNLVGILHERGEQTFERAHVALPASIVAACRSTGVRRIVHMSALGASRDAPRRYLRSKAEGEALVVASGLDTTVFAPSVVFGRGDSFLTMLAGLLRLLPVVVLAAPDARFQPVWVGDVAHCFAHALDDPRTIGHRYELGGPRTYTLRQLVEWVGETTGHVRPVIPLGRSLSALQARVLECLPGKLMTRDNLASMQVPNVTAQPFPPVFGITPAALEAIGPTYLGPAATRSAYDGYRTHGAR